MLPGTTPVILLTLWWPLPWTQVPWLSFQGRCQILSLICFKGARFLFGAEAELSIVMCDLLARLWSTAQNIKLILKVKGGKYSWEILWRLETSLHNYSVVQFFVCILSIFCSFFTDIWTGQTHGVALSRTPSPLPLHPCIQCRKEWWCHSLCFLGVSFPAVSSLFLTVLSVSWAHWQNGLRQLFTIRYIPESFNYFGSVKHCKNQLLKILPKKHLKEIYFH